MSSSLLQTSSSCFKDTYNRTVILRGINLSASSKLPFGRASHETDSFWEEGESGDLTYVGRPFPLWDPDYTKSGSKRNDEEEEEEEDAEGWYTSKWEESADCHLARLRGWGFNVLRYVITWEALEHRGPGQYDYEFIDYTIAILRKCKHYGFKVYIDPHQDIWSRFSGGSGAPYWTLIACGLNPRHFTQTATAILHHEYNQPDPAHLPAMVWSTGYNRFAAQTLFTLFFGGKTYAPKCIIDDVNIQDYLQSHFIEAFGLLADKIRQVDVEYDTALLDDCVIGWDSMNEPFAGFCALCDIEKDSTAHGASLKKGLQPTVVQNLNLGMGVKQVVENWEFGSFGPKQAGEVEVDPKGVRMWITAEEAGEIDGVSARWGWRRSAEWELGSCVWALHGVWSPDSSQILKPAYFAHVQDGDHQQERRASFLPDFWLPHFESYATRIRSSHPKAILFVQPPVFQQPIPIPESILKGRACLSTHYYDGLTLVTRHWNWFNADALGLIRGHYRWTWQAIKIGSSAIRSSLQSQLAMLKADAASLTLDPSSPSSSPSTQHYPTLIGEIGTPMDLDNKRAYGLPYADKKDGDAYKGDFSEQVKALDASLNALDGDNCLSAAIWCYAVGNGHRWGDQWNMEDLSLWSMDDVVDAGVVPEAGGEEKDASSSRANLLTANVNNQVLNDDDNTPNNDSKPQQPDNGDETNSAPDADLELEQPPLTVPSLAPIATSSNMSSSLTLGVDEGESGPEPGIKGVTAEDAEEDDDEGKADRETKESFKSLRVDTDMAVPTKTAINNVISPVSASPLDASYPNPFATTTALPPPLSTERLSPSLAYQGNRPPHPLSSVSHPTTHNPRLPTNNKTPASARMPTVTKSPSSASLLHFLTSGARAVKAFSRPYPVATVGKPVNVRFDVETGEFRMGVLVSTASSSSLGRGVGGREEMEEEEEEEVGYPPLARSRGREDESNGGGGGDAELMPTEIFVPLVHYASTDVLEMCKGMTRRGFVAPSMSPPSPLPPSASSSAPPAQTRQNATSIPSSPYLHPPPPHGRYGSDDTELSTPTTPTTPQSIVTHYSTASTLAPQPNSNSRSRVNLDINLDMNLEIEVSHGTTVVEGQYLKWYYALPRVDQGEVMYEIRVRRGAEKAVDENEEWGGTGEERKHPTCWDVVERCWNGLVGS